MAHILIVDADAQFRTMLVRLLKSKGHRATAIGDSDTLASTLAIQRPDIVLLDLMFEANLHGIEVCQRLRTWSSIPVIITSTCNDEPIKVSALDAGADDYMVKPFGVDEFLARVRAIQRRLVPRSSNQTPWIRLKDLTVDLEGHTVWQGNEMLHLTRKEYDLLRVLALAEGRLVTYEKLIQEVWGTKNDTERGSVRTLVKQLRHKLGEDLNNPMYILTQAGIGYRLNVSSG